jgi:polysaccharide export outer membrane protein
MILPGLFSCYSSSAIKGTPINEVKVSEDLRKPVNYALTQEQKDEIAAMSRVQENAVFNTIRGIPEYRIGPLDILEITTHIGDKVTQTLVTVNSRGLISYSFIDDLDVAGLTPSQLDEQLTKALANYIKNPRVDILVKEFKSKSATILGELASLRGTYLGTTGSGRIYLSGRITIMDLIAMGGGYTVDADVKNIKLTRKGAVYNINLYNILEKKDENWNMIVDDGDVLDVPSLPAFGERVYVVGAVNSQGIYSLKDARDLLGAVSLAGSFTAVAREENTLVVRGYEYGKTPDVMMANLNALLRKADLSQNIPLEDGDLVYVPRMRIGDINDWITNTIPLLDLLFYPARYDEEYGQ